MRLRLAAKLMLICVLALSLCAPPPAIAGRDALTHATADAAKKKKKKRKRVCRKRIRGKVRRVKCKKKKAKKPFSDQVVLLPGVPPPLSPQPAGPTTPPLPDGAPHILYTDITSGPAGGGENNQGAYLTIFGKNFGSGGLGTTLHVYINNFEVGAYRSLGFARGRSDVQQLVVQVGALGGAAPGVNLPIKITVGGVASNTDQTFMVQPGRMLYVDKTSGDDATAVPGDITNPYRHVQVGTNLAAGAWGAALPGDTIVMRGGTWTDIGRENYFIRFIKADGSSGTPPTGVAGHGPITLIGYPGEDTFINADSSTHAGGAISGLNGQNYPNAGKWINISNLRVEGGGYDGPISQQIYGDNWRIVNNELSAETGVTTGPSASKMAGITGNGVNSKWLGNHIHDIWGSPQEAHGVYIDGDGSYEIAYNHIHDIHSGNGVLLYCNGGNGSDYIDDVRFHHNSIADVTKHLINVADGSRDGVEMWNNIAQGSDRAAIRFNTTDLHGAKFFNNTFYDINRGLTGPVGALTNDWGLPTDAVDIRNNIFALTNGTDYEGGSVGLGGPVGTITNNLYFGGAGSLGFDLDPIGADPLFVGAPDFSLQPSSPAIDAGSSGVSPIVSNDFSGATSRPVGAGYDIGAFER